MALIEQAETTFLLPESFRRWFAGRGWAPRAHQLELLAKSRAWRSVLLIAPTGGGKTLAGFLPTLVELHETGARPKNLVSSGRAVSRSQGLHTLYISPLKALAVDIARNLEIPVREMGLKVRLETRTGDTPTSRRQRQRRYPPDVLLTTPEQLALLLASADAPYLFGTLRRVVLDELHSLVTSKRGDLLSLGLARLFALAPQLTTVGLSATVAEPAELCRFLVAQPQTGEARADLIVAEPGAQPKVTMLDTAEHLPWAGHSAGHALGEIYELIKTHKTTLVFVNTRSQAEFIFQALWGINDDDLAIALHHGSLDVAQRRKVEDAMVAGLECRAAIDAVADNAQDTPPLRTGALDVLAQHVLGRAVGAPFLPDELYEEVRAAAPYASLARSDFDAAVDFVATGGYALKAYERFAKIRQGKDGRWRITHPRVAQRYRMNVGTIVEADMIKVRLVRSRASKAIPRGGRLLGEVEEYFIETDEVDVSRAHGTDPKVPAYEGGKFPHSTYLAARVRAILADNKAWRALPAQVREWLEIQAWRSLLPRAGDLLVETFPRAAKHYLVCYPFEGRLAHQTLGMLLTRRLERAGLKPLGFVANEYALAVWGVGDLGLRIQHGELSLPRLFDQDMLGDDLEEWLAESALMKRTFRSCAIIAGLIECRVPGEEKSRRQLTVSTDLVYDVLRKHQADHLLLRAARGDAASGLLDIKRLGELLSRIEGRIVHKALDHVSPLAVPVLLEIGRETVYGEGADALLAEAADELVKEAMR
ncbi:MAG: DEAD/DEAH box helicase [Pseudolabrys sp.]